MKSEPEKKLSERVRRGVGRGVAALLVAVLTASGLGCVPKAKAGTAGSAEVGREASFASRGALLGDGGPRADEGDDRAAGSVGGVERSEASGNDGSDGQGNAAASGPLSEVSAAVSRANVQRLREVARID